ncbi:Type I secretion system ATP-binding protein PrsD [compost metagenome]
MLNRAITAARSRGTTVVVVTHRMGVLSVVNKLLLLREGQQVAFGPRDEVMAAVQQAQGAAQSRVAQNSAVSQAAGAAQ